MIAGIGSGCRTPSLNAGTGSEYNRNAVCRHRHVRSHSAHVGYGGILKQESLGVDGTLNAARLSEKMYA